MAWRVTAEDVRLFREELWKDERSFKTLRLIGTNEFAKDCFDNRRANLECKVLELLSSGATERLCPTPREVRDTVLIMERVRGMRLFDFLRALREIEFRRRDALAARAADVILYRCERRLAEIQRRLHEAKSDICTGPYPMASKLSMLLLLLSRIFGVSALFERCGEDIDRFTKYWSSNCCQVPFRDATTKNMFLGEPRLDLGSVRDEYERIKTIESILESQSEAYWDSIALLDVDFSSAEHLTAAEDDPISLFFHEWTNGSRPLSSQSLVLCSDLWAADGYRAAATLLVRYLRFGGRKLGYKLVNSQGFRVRFRYDDPLFYFSSLQDKCARLSRQFTEDFSTLFSLIARLSDLAHNPDSADRELLAVDQFRRVFSDRADYWQENPSEQSIRTTQ